MRRLLSCGLVTALVLSGPANVFAAARKPAAARQDQQTGAVKGEAKDEKGRTIAAAKIRVRNAATGAIAAEVVANSAGGFLATGLVPASYVIEVVGVNGAVIGLSPAIAVAAGTTATVTVTATAVGAIAAAAAGGAGIAGLGTAATVGLVTAAGVAAAVGIRAAVKDASPSGQ